MTVNWPKKNCTPEIVNKKGVCHINDAKTGEKLLTICGHNGVNPTEALTTIITALNDKTELARTLNAELQAEKEAHKHLVYRIKDINRSLRGIINE